jgi:ABC-type amino acid transport substrate-binding protein
LQEPGYRVVWPLGKAAYQPVALKPRPAGLTGLTVCELSDYGFRAEEIFPIIRELLSQKYPDIKFVEYPVFGNTHGAREVEIIANLAEKLKNNKCDAVISGVGG